MTGVQTCALPICFPVTIACGTVCIADSFEQLHRVLPILVPALDDENKLPSAIIELKSYQWAEEII